MSASGQQFPYLPRDPSLGQASLAAEEVPGTISLPEIAEAGGEAGEGGIEVFADLGLEHGAFADEFTAVPYQEL